VKLLVATGRTQGARPNDFTFAIDGELVYAGLNDRGGPTDAADFIVDRLLEQLEPSGVGRSLPVHHP